MAGIHVTLIGVTIRIPAAAVVIHCLPACRVDILDIGRLYARVPTVLFASL